MIFKKLAVLFLILLLVCTASANRRRDAGTLTGDTDECITGKEICDYAWEMQREYDAMPDSTSELREQKRAFLNALNTSRVQCERAKKECARSIK